MKGSARSFGNFEEVFGKIKEFSQHSALFLHDSANLC